MFPIRVKTVQESDLRMLGNLARNIQRVLPVTQADIDAAAALGKGWVVWKVFEVSDPLDNLRGGTQLIIRQNSILPGQNVRRVIFVAGPGGQTVVIRGSDYIVLPDAIANSLQYVKAFGGTEQRNIPQPYTQVNYVTNNAQTAVNTGIMIDFAKNYEFEVECRAVSGSWYILQSRASASGNVTGIHGETSGSTIKLVVGNVTVCTSAITRTVGNKLYVKATLNAGTATLYVKDETANTEDTQTGSYGTSQPNPTAAVYLLGNAGGQYVDVNSDIYMARIKENDTVVMDYVPARQVATAGFYDKASGTFKTALTPANLSADGNTVPTPDAPMDIVSNNGVLKARHQSGLPLGYTLLDSVVFDSTQMIDTGFTPDNNSRIESKLYRTGADCWLYGASPTNPRVTLYHSSTGTSRWGNQSRSAFGFVADTEYTLIQDKNGININGVDTPWNSGSAGDFTCDRSLTIGNNNGSTGTRYFAGNLYYMKIYDNGVLVRDFVPCQNASNVVGLYDRVNGVFYTDTGLVAGDPVSDPVEIYADGTVETINVHGKNLFDKSDVITGKILNDTGAVVTQSSGYYSGHISVDASTGYTISQTGGEEIYLRILEYDSTDTMVKLNKGTQTGTQTKTFTTDANTAYVIVSGSTKSNALDTLQLERGSTATTYTPYYNGGTATAEMLLKVGDYQDVQSIIDGVVTRNVGVKVLDGTEAWNVETENFGAVFTFIPAPGAKGGVSNPPMCSHFKTNNITGTSNIANLHIGWSANSNAWIGFRDDNIQQRNDWKQYLAAQYAAGTPIIVIYPLVEPTTESVTGQTLQVTDGDNVLEITQASLSNLELEAEYQAAVSLTIQEVQDANLDPNVEVTIN